MYGYTSTLLLIDIDKCIVLSLTTSTSVYREKYPLYWISLENFTDISWFTVSPNAWIFYLICCSFRLWFSPVSSTNKTDRHNITEILSNVALNTITHPLFFLSFSPRHDIDEILLTVTLNTKNSKTNHSFLPRHDIDEIFLTVTLNTKNSKTNHSCLPLYDVYFI